MAIRSRNAVHMSGVPASTHPLLIPSCDWRSRRCQFEWRRCGAVINQFDTSGPEPVGPEIEERWNSEVADGFSDRGSSGRVLSGGCSRCRRWGVASAETVGQAIVAAAQGIQSQAYPQQPVLQRALHLLLRRRGTTSGATPGGYDTQGTDGSYSNCNSIGRTGFDCRGLALYAPSIREQVARYRSRHPQLELNTRAPRVTEDRTFRCSSRATRQSRLLRFEQFKHRPRRRSWSRELGHRLRSSALFRRTTGSTTKTVSWFQAELSWVGAVAIPNVTGSTFGRWWGFRTAKQSATTAMVTLLPEEHRSTSAIGPIKFAQSTPSDSRHKCPVEQPSKQCQPIAQLSEPQGTLLGTTTPSWWWIP